MEKLIFEKSVKGRASSYVQKPDISLKEAENFIPSRLLRSELPLPSLGELDVIRHYTRLSQLNFGIDTHFYPLGSCTMKYNPKVNEELARFDAFTCVHPYQDEKDIQGCLEVLYNLEKLLFRLTGMPYFTFQPCAGAHGELTGMLIISAWHRHNKKKRYKVIVPDSSHGTNPATAKMCGYELIVVRSTPQGLIDIDEANRVVDADTAALMLTNPNTLGLFEEQIFELSEIIHRKGGLLYYDGANFNALLGVTQPSLMGFDVIHLNLHKTFSTPHGGGGPGAGAVGVRKDLGEFLPVPVVEKRKNKYCLNYQLPRTIGKVHSFYGNFGVLLKAYAYLLRLGKEGVLRVSQNAVLNARYIQKKLGKFYNVASSKECMHEVVFSALDKKKYGMSAIDIAKRLIDYGVHPPTMHFPLSVKEALMIEPTETESKETLDYFIEVMKKINVEIKEHPELLIAAPHTTPVRRLDEVKAARFPDLRWRKNGE